MLADQPLSLRRQLVRLIGSMYPGNRYIVPLMPDLLGEHLVAKVEEESPGASLAAIFGTQERAPP